MTDPIKELGDALKSSGMKIKFGLRAQGHIPTVRRMLAAGASWDEIGREIGWHGDTARKWFERVKP